MTRATIAGVAFVTALVLLLIAFVVRSALEDVDPVAVTPDAIPSSAPAVPEAQPGFIYGRITTSGGVTHEGRLRWGGDQEAFWGDFFNGTKTENRWASYLPTERERRRIEIFGFTFSGEERSKRLRRGFLARFGDIARVEAHVLTVQVTLKSGTGFELDRLSAGDIDDGVRVWDKRGGIVDLDARQIRTIEFLPTPPLAGAPSRLHGKVITRQGIFTGFIQWNEQDSAGTDTLDGRAADGERSLRYDTIRSITRDSRDNGRVTLLDGRELTLSSGEVSQRNRGINVEDTRYGRVQISWDAFERVDFSPGGSGPGFGDYSPGRALAGSVTTRDGRHLSGRLVYDFDESETTETLDVALPGMDYNITFSLIASIVPRGPDGGRAIVTLHDGEALQLDRNGDLGEGNAGLLIFSDGRADPEYVPWKDVERVDLSRAALPR